MAIRCAWFQRVTRFRSAVTAVDKIPSGRKSWLSGQVAFGLTVDFESLFDTSHVELSAHRSSPQRQSPKTGTRIRRNKAARQQGLERTAHRFQLSSGSCQTIRSTNRWPASSNQGSAIRNAEMRIESKRLPQRADTAISRNDIRDERIGAPQRGQISCFPLSRVSL